MHVISTERRDELQERFRLHLLPAMDEAMNRLSAEHGWAAPDNCTGARDADLPELFKAMDAQFARNLAHLGVIVRDDDAGDYDKADQRWGSQ